MRAPDGICGFESQRVMGWNPIWGITLVKFLSVGLLLVNCPLTVDILPADSWPTVYRQSADKLLGELFFTFIEKAVFIPGQYL